MEETMHEFQYMQFNKMVKWKNGQLCKQWRRMLSKTRITYNSDSLFLFYPQFIKTCCVCTAVDINTVYYMRMHHGKVQHFSRFLVYKIFYTIDAEQGLGDFRTQMQDMIIKGQIFVKKNSK